MSLKIKAYINLAIRSGQVARGTDEILKQRNLKLVIISPKLSENAINKIKNKNLADLLILDNVLPDGTLALGITNANLSDAIIAESKKQEE